MPLFRCAFCKKESCEAGFSACGGSRKRHSTIPPQCDPCGAFLSYGNEVSYTIKKRPSTENSAKGRLNPNAVPPLFSGKTDLLQRLRRQLFRNLVAVIPLEPLSDNGDYRESLPRSCAFSSPIPKPHSVLLCSGLLSAIRDPLCQPGKRTLLLPHLCPCTMYTIGKN